MAGGSSRCDSPLALLRRVDDVFGGGSAFSRRPEAEAPDQEPDAGTGRPGWRGVTGRFSAASIAAAASTGIGGTDFGAACVTAGCGTGVIGTSGDGGASGDEGGIPADAGGRTLAG